MSRWSNRFCLMLLIFLPFSDVSWAAQTSQAEGLSDEARQSFRVTQPASQLIPTERSIERFVERVNRNPNDYRSASILGRLYLRQAKEQDDFESFIKAEEVFQTIVDKHPELVLEKTLLAESLMSQHRFHEAKQLAEEIANANPDALTVLGTLGDANLNLGNLDEAEKTYQRLLKKSQSPAVKVRMARLLEMKGQVTKAIELIRAAVNEQVATNGLPATEAWYRWRLGRAYFEAGNSNAAKAEFQEALRLVTDDSAALAGLGMIAATTGDLKLAIDYYQQAIDASEEPPILIAMGDVYLRNRQPEFAERCYERADQLMAEESRHPIAGPAHARERAIFFVEHDRSLPLALKLAQDDLNNRSDIYAYDLLAWAYFKNGKLAQAGKAIERALASGTQDAKILFHSGMIKLEQGETREGLSHLKGALQRNPNFSILDAEVARDTLKKYEANSSQ